DGSHRTLSFLKKSRGGGAGIAAQQAERRLCEIVGTEREEVGALWSRRDIGGTQRRSRKLYHSADIERDGDARLRLNGLRGIDDDGAQNVEFAAVRDEGDHHLGPDSSSSLG